MTPLVVPALGCVLQIAETDLTATDEGWREALHLEVAATPTCPWVDLVLPPGVVLEEQGGREIWGDGTRVKLADHHWERRPRDLEGEARVRVHLPELLGGDRAVIEAVRAWTRPGPFPWRPGLDGARWASLAVDGEIEVRDATGVTEERRGWHAAEPGPEAGLRVVAPAHPPAEPFEPLPPAGDVRIEERLTLQVPRGDPQLTLYPGGGSSVRRELFLAFAPSDLGAGYAVPLPAEQALQLSVEPDGAARVERTPDTAFVRVRPSEGPTRVTLAWEEPDAPTYGERPATVDSLSVDVRGGEIAWEGDAWRLVQVSGRPIMPQRDILLAALDHRFRAASMPEPGLPTTLRGRSASRELAAELRPVLLERVQPATWPADPLWPRKLVRARKKGALTSTEAALTLWLYARQAGFGADWALVRPAPAGPGPQHAPAGYTEAVVRVEHEGEVWWIDPLCTVCAPFELRPELEGASALGLDVTTTPPPRPGRSEVVVGEEEVRWQLEGPPALQLRLWVAQLPEEGRGSALAERLAGPGARLGALEGLDEAGAPVSVTARGGDGLQLDPLALSPLRDDGTVWAEWVGRRVLRRPGVARAVELEQGPLRYTRRVEGGEVVEELVLSERLLPAAVVEAYEAARATPEPEPEPEPDDVSPPESDPASP